MAWTLTPAQAARARKLAAQKKPAPRSTATQVFKRQAPVSIQARETGGLSSFSQFGDEKYEYGTLKPLNRNGSPNGLFHEYRDGWKHAALTIGNGKGGVLDNTRFEFWCIDVSYGYNSVGESSQSKYYSAYYPKSFNRTPLTISARVPTEAYKEDMQNWIRSSQINMARGDPRIWLTVPAANIAVWGYIPNFQGGMEAGFEPAPEVNFEFVVTRNPRIDDAGAISQMVVAYFLDPQDKFWGPQSTAFAGAVYDQLESDFAAQLAQQKKDSFTWWGGEGSG